MMKFFQGGIGIDTVSNYMCHVYFRSVTTVMFVMSHHHFSSFKFGNHGFSLLTLYIGPFFNQSHILADPNLINHA